jgi:hypothetical protein
MEQEAENAPCGSNLDLECDKPDFCGADGECKPNYVAKDVVCGSDASPSAISPIRATARKLRSEYVRVGKTLRLCGRFHLRQSGFLRRLWRVLGHIAGKEVVCRESSDVCDPAENCDGAGACPADVRRTTNGNGMRTLR